MSNERDKPKNEVRATRRNFLRSTARAGLAGLALPALGGNWSAAHAAITADKRGYARGFFVLELDGVVVGSVSAVSGGAVFGDVVLEKPGPDRIRRKHLAGVRVEPISIEVGLPMAKPFYEWLKSSFEPRLKPMRKRGAVLTLDHAGKLVSRLDFLNALITEVEFPACGAASKEPAVMTVTFAPERLDAVSSRAVAAVPQAIAKEHRWMIANYRLNIQGLEDATRRAAKIEALPIKLETVPSAVGEQRDYGLERVSIDFPNLVIAIPEANARPMYDWHQDFVVKGNNAQERERVGVLEYLTPNDQSVLLAVNFFNLGIFRIEPETTTFSDAIRRTKVSMYCEAITADFKV